MKKIVLASRSPRRKGLIKKVEGNIDNIIDLPTKLLAERLKVL